MIYTMLASDSSDVLYSWKQLIGARSPPAATRHSRWKRAEQVCSGKMGEKETWTNSCTMKRGGTSDGGQPDYVYFVLSPEAGPGCHLGPCLSPSLPHTGSMSESMSHVINKGHVDIRGLRCHWVHADAQGLHWTSPAPNPPLLSGASGDGDTVVEELALLFAWAVWESWQAD